MVLSCFDLKFYLNQKFGTIKNNIKISGKTLFPVQIILLIIKRLEVSFSFMFNVSCITLFFQKSCKIMQKNINFSFDTFLHSVSLSQIRYNITNYIDKYITIL
ncbi:hypothetical protein CPARA_3gp358 (nucleomorph) [Cryptomonas paramecium]|uniref:Uncharacterized protein n=1 Tax=Cryptomonas paramaecium TaxID=2898 RepID=F2HI92_9CRYP|nr:hypothetical protein CPARA_3gp358 [Cryptomonas paramecium]AEA39016.1 hypothetical protein CPARA_3gp358 [Cryptomonas paramecium]